jgi:type IV secretion system protein VirB10
MTHRSMIGFVILVCMIPCEPAQMAGAAGLTASSASQSTPVAQDGVKSYTVPAGTRILLSLKSEISTRVAMPGDPVYLVSEFPVVEDGAVVLPAGMYVRGVIDSVQRPGKVKGRAQLQMHFVSMMFQNGVEIALSNGSLAGVPGSGGAKVKNAEGTVEQAGSKGQDTQRIASNTLEGTGVGTIAGYGAGNVGMGAGIGAGAGAAAGVLTTLFTRGNDIVFPQGTALEMVLNRPLVLQQTQLAGMPAYTGIPIPAPAATQQMPAATPKPSN